MIAIAEIKTKMPRVVQIKAVRYVAPYKLHIRFDDGRENTVDFGPFLKGSAHPSIRAYIDVKQFKRFVIEEGILHWNDFDLVFPMADLYKGKIS